MSVGAMETCSNNRPMASLLLQYLHRAVLASPRRSAVDDGDDDPAAFATSTPISNRKWPRPKVVVATSILAFCLKIAFVIIKNNDELTTSGSLRHGVSRRQERRLYKVQVLDDEHRLMTTEEESNTDMIHSWAPTHLLPISTPPNPLKETALFWHIPKSGGTTAKELYRCLGTKIEIASRPTDIFRARKNGLVQSGNVDVIFSALPVYALQKLFDENHSGRMLALFRHPVERLISKFYYLQIATWEKTYRPEWKEMDLLDWAKSYNTDNKYVKTLAGKYYFDEVTEEDLEIAKHTIQLYFDVGLTNQMEESMRRFNVILGIDDEGDRKKAKCMNSFFRSKKPAGKKNSNPHPKVEEDDPAYQFLAKRNSFDIRLYEFIEDLFEQQQELIDSYRNG